VPPKSDIAAAYSIASSALAKRLHHEPERLGRLEVDHQLEFDRKPDA
jgi:hypothetical protein